MRASNMDFVLILILIIVACFGALGFVSGQESGEKRACESVKLEWVKDKCMKVTREAV